MTHFKTQQEVMKYVADGGAVINAVGGFGLVIEFVNGFLNHDRYDFSDCGNWQPYIKPAPKTKVWRWEKVETMHCGDKYLDQTHYLISEEKAANVYPGYTKVEGSEREI